MKPHILNPDNFFNFVDKTDSCWNFIPKSKEATRTMIYRFLDKRIRPSHIAWYLCKGRFVDGELWSKCRNLFCVNPDHHDEYKRGDMKPRFMIKVNYSQNGCWEWTGYISPGGYGIFKVGHKAMIASRASYIIFVGEIPEGMDVLHTCDNRKCVNPDHLFLGKDIDNCMDKELKNRGGHKLTPDEVRKIREESKTAISKVAVGRKYHISKGNTYKVINRKIWRWIK
jgi:hypothetical protein